MVAHRKNKRMICFEMDSILVTMEGIDEMARKMGVHREVSRITDKAMRGDFDFEESLRQRVAMLRGLPLDDLMEIRNQMNLSKGAEELLTTRTYPCIRTCRTRSTAHPVPRRSNWRGKRAN